MRFRNFRQNFCSSHFVNLMNRFSEPETLPMSGYGRQNGIQPL